MNRIPSSLMIADVSRTVHLIPASSDLRNGFPSPLSRLVDTLIIAAYIHL